VVVAASGGASKKLILLAVVLGGVSLLSPILTRRFVIEAFQIPSVAMIPTLLVGDHIFCGKLRQEVRRGEVVVFRYPPEPTTDFIKRVIGLAGDTVEVARDGVVAINGNPVPRHLVDHRCAEGTDEGRGDCEQWEETIGDHSFMVVHQRSVHAFRPVVVPEGSVFVMGDNRENSSDSRVWGFVPLANVKGHADTIWWSSGPHGPRWDRMGRTVR
jgi:signal peptidase I